MAFGKFFSSMKGLFSEGPMKELSEEMADAPEVKLSAEKVAFTDEFRETFNVNSPVKDNIRNSSGLLGSFGRAAIIDDCNIFVS